MELPLLDIMYKWNHTVCCLLCLSPLSIIFSVFLHVVVHISTASNFLALVWISTVFSLPLLGSPTACSPRKPGWCSSNVNQITSLLYLESSKGFLFYLENSFFFFTLQYCIGFTIHQHASAPSIHVFPILNPPPTSLLLPSLWVIPVHQPQASCTLHRTWTGDSFLVWYYTSFNAILPNHPLPSLPQSPKDCSIHLCLFCCLACRVVVTIFLNSIYMC